MSEKKNTKKQEYFFTGETYVIGDVWSLEVIIYDKQSFRSKRTVRLSDGEYEDLQDNGDFSKHLPVGYYSEQYIRDGKFFHGRCYHD